jgi:hypothetical protein
MKRFGTKRLTEEAALAVVQNFRYFGWYTKVTKIRHNVYAVRARDWAWSHFVLTPEDLA